MQTMNKNNENFVVSVDAHGNAVTDYDRVSFTVTVTVNKPKISDVKATLVEHNSNFNKVLDEIKNESSVKIDDETLSTSSMMNKLKCWDNKKEKEVDRGYWGVFTATFESTTPEEASLIYDKLTNLEEFDVSAPEFKLRNQEKLKLEALKDAYARLLERFKTECNVLGKDYKRYNIVSWKVNYGHNATKTYSNVGAARVATVASPDESEISIQQSKAVVTVYLTVTYQEKN